MKLKKTFFNYDLGKNHFVGSVDRKEFAGLVRSNDSAAFIINCLKKDITREELLTKLQEKYDASEQQLNAGVDIVLDNLRQINALDE